MRKEGGSMYCESQCSVQCGLRLCYRTNSKGLQQSIKAVGFEKIDPLPSSEALRDCAVIQTRGDDEYFSLWMLYHYVECVLYLFVQIACLSNRALRQANEHV